MNALLGTANLILQQVGLYEPRAVVVCFGAEAAHYRVELFDGYHADRIDVPDELGPQFADAPDFFRGFGWTVAAHESLEADDLLGAYAPREAEAGGEALVMTGDRDMFQCVGERVKMLYVRFQKHIVKLQKEWAQPNGKWRLECYCQLLKMA